MKIGVILTFLAGLLLALTTPGAGNDEGDVVHPEVPRITAKELKQLMDEKGEYILVDTRDSYSYDHGHINGAVNIYNDPQGDPFLRRMMLRALPRDKLIILYCDWPDDNSSAGLALELWALGYDRDKVKVLAEGTLRWTALDYPLIATKN